MLPLSVQLHQLFTGFTFTFLLQAALSTLALAVAGCSCGLLVGLVVACLRRSRTLYLLPLRMVLVVFVELMRRIPFLVTLFLTLFVLQALGTNLSFFSIALIAVCLIATAYLAEIFRAGFDSVPQPQIDAAKTLNFSPLQILFTVMLPQSWKVVLPPAFSFMVSFIKDTALASQLGVVELTFAGKILITRGYSAFLIYGLVMLVYFALSWPLSLLGAWLEQCTQRAFNPTADAMPAGTTPITPALPNPALLDRR
ncbi:amino acid ABC transporter permease [Pseudomonas typographi]|uniref:Amino acid ABC transporter permease n=1 Tax=Pseudomonas typographi TaxID=2715964 RepID=A0ABR7Z7F0_9PSED|nr:amino acid ABC transporter permease [Pseudomonas typographi]MBD1551113.1 amino acid ABC transporter permease [Pseudomonas typographi]MBD1601352.1 amino acid ABC transporter permease [Pseudomonas typographi]